jgi:Leucine-rich repeat (LRR) protein
MLPHTLEKLNCSENKALANLPAMPVTLEYLDCSGCVLTYLQDFPADSELKVLNCMSNKITRLPQLPTKLVTLKCAYNLLVSLPAPLPNKLCYLECSFNHLTNLPTPLPESLEDLICSHNRLTSLPSPLPANMDTLHSAANKLSWLPELPNKLSELDCQNNNLSVFPIPVPITLTWLDCRDNPMLKWLPKLSVNMSYMWQDNVSLPVNEYEDLVEITPEIMEYVNMENERLFNKWLCDRLSVYRSELLERQLEITLNPDRVSRLIRNGELGELGTWSESLS